MGGQLLLDGAEYLGFCLRIAFCKGQKGCKAGILIGFLCYILCFLCNILCF